MTAHSKHDDKYESSKAGATKAAPALDTNAKKVIIKTGDNAGKEGLSQPRYYSKLEHLVKELCHREILISDAQTLQALALQGKHPCLAL